MTNLFYKNERYPSADSRNILKILTKMMTIIEKYWQNFAKSCVVTKLFKHGRGSFPQSGHFSGVALLNITEFLC